MMAFLNILLLTFGVSDGSKGISELNSLKKSAQQSYESGDYKKASETYSYLVDSLHIKDDKALMNLANSYYKMANTKDALSSYQRLQDSKNNQLKSQAYQQLGVLSKDPKTLENALAYFKESIKSDPTNNDVRYNYELVKKKLQKQQDQNKDKDEQNKDEKNKDKDNKKDKDKEKKEEEKDKKDKGDNKDEQQQDEQKKDQKEEGQKGEEEKKEEQKSGEEKKEEGEKGEEQKDQQEQKEGEKGEEKEEKQSQESQEGEEKEGEKKEQQAPQKSTAEKLQKINISKEKAQMILEALKNNEIQYIQQNRRKPTKRKDSSKPDW